MSSGSLDSDGLYQVLTSFLVGGTVLLERSVNYPFLLFEKIKEGEGYRFSDGAYDCGHAASIRFTAV